MSAALFVYMAQCHVAESPSVIVIVIIRGVFGGAYRLEDRAMVKT